MFFNSKQLQQMAETEEAFAAGEKVFDANGELRLLNEKLQEIRNWTQDYLTLVPPTETAARASLAKKANPLLSPEVGYWRK